MAGNLFFGMFLTLYSGVLIFQRSHVSICFKWVHSHSALNAILLVVLEHPSTFLAAIICAVSSCFTNFAFPAHTSPAYSRLDTTTFNTYFYF